MDRPPASLIPSIYFHSAPARAPRTAYPLERNDAHMCRNIPCHARSPLLNVRVGTFYWFSHSGDRETLIRTHAVLHVLQGWAWILGHERTHPSGLHHLREMSMKSTHAPVSGDLCVLLLSAASRSWFVHACVCWWPDCDRAVFTATALVWSELSTVIRGYRETVFFHCSTKHKHIFTTVKHFFRTTPSSFFLFGLLSLKLH